MLAEYKSQSIKLQMASYLFHCIDSTEPNSSQKDRYLFDLYNLKRVFLRTPILTCSSFQQKSLSHLTKEFLLNLTEKINK